MTEPINTQSILREQIKEHLIENPIERGKPGCYQDVANKFKVDPEYVRDIYRKLRKKGLVKDNYDFRNDPANGSRQYKENVKSGEADIHVVTKKRIKTLADLIEICEIDIKEWEIVSWECNKWEVGRKDKLVEWHIKKGQVEDGNVSDSGKIFVEPLFQVKAKLARRKLDTDLGKQKELLLKELKAFSPVAKGWDLEKLSVERNTLLEICVPDLHFGKLSWREETGEDYDLKIAEVRVKKAVKELLTRVNLNNVEKILFPVGNDLINIDNRQNTTFAGTPQDTDCRFMKIFRTVKRILIEIVVELSAIAPVDVVVVPGNHDLSTAFLIGEVMEAFFHNNEKINVDNAPKLRKYYKYGKNGFQLTHGNEEKHNDLGLIFATEEPQLWADTKFRYAQLGHFHKNKKTNYVSVDEFQGFQVNILPSLTGTDFWHKSKGYNTLKQAKALLYDRVHGPIGEFTTTV